MKHYLLFFLLLSLPVWSSEATVKRVFAHLAIQDPEEAVREAGDALRKNTRDEQLWRAYIAALAESGNERKMLQAWNDFCTFFPEMDKDRQLLETVSWGILKRGVHSDLFSIRGMAIIGGALTQDAQGVELVRVGLSDPNHLVRAVAVQLSTKLRDAKLQDEVLRIFQEEKQWGVRLQAIQAVGALKIEAAKPDLMEMIASSSTIHEEKAVALEALVNLMDTADRESIEYFVNSSRAGLRELGCQAVAYFDLTECLDLLVPLVKDPLAEIRALSLRIIGLSGVKEISGQSVISLAKEALRDPDDRVMVTAAWLITVHDPEKGKIAFEPIFQNSPLDTVRLAAAALSASGNSGISIIKQRYKREKDRFVKMNLALGLIGQREWCDSASHCLAEGLKQDSSQWIWEEKGGFQVLSPASRGSRCGLLSNPVITNKITRLDILTILAMLRQISLEDVIRGFLQERQWGVTGMASALLLTEGDEEAYDQVEALFADPSPTVRIQAALVVALWGQRESALTVLKEGYPSADRETKERIIEAMGRIGSDAAAEFLVEKLHESHQTLRLIAAASLLNYLYH